MLRRAFPNVPIVDPTLPDMESQGADASSCNFISSVRNCTLTMKELIIRGTKKLVWNILNPIIIIGTYAWTGELRSIYPMARCNHETCIHHGKFREVKGFYTQLNYAERGSVKWRRIILVWMSRIGCLLLLWLVVVIFYLPSLTLGRGIFVRDLSLLATVVWLGYPCTYVSMGLSTQYLHSRWLNPPPERHHYLRFLRGSMTGAVYFFVVGVAWLVYFRSCRSFSRHSRRIDRYVIYSLGCLCVGTFLWGLKTVVWLRWIDCSICKRFKRRIMVAGCHLFFLSLVIDHVPLHVPSRSLVKSHLQSKKPSIYDVCLVADQLVALAERKSRETDDLSEIIEEDEQEIKEKGVSEFVSADALKSVMTSSDAAELELFLEHFQKEYGSQNIDKLMKAHKNCLSTGFTLRDAFAAVRILDTILALSLVVVLTLVWLFITELVTIKTLLFIASPFLAFSFIFADSGKLFFQGVTFSYINHPFDVGDCCSIDGIEVEIKRINILTTTGSSIKETGRTIIYQNVNLAKKDIIKITESPVERDGSKGKQARAFGNDDSASDEIEDETEETRTGIHQENEEAKL